MKETIRIRRLIYPDAKGIRFNINAYEHRAMAELLRDAAVELDSINAQYRPISTGFYLSLGIALLGLPIKMMGMSTIIPIKMNDNDAIEILRRCVADDSKVFICQHARERMKERNITRPQVLSCLERGKIIESPCRDPRGDWRCTIEHYTSGNVVTVAVAIKYNDNGERIVVVTVF
jgi:hypothetical protein